MGGFFKEARFAFNAIRNLASRSTPKIPRPTPQHAHAPSSLIARRLSVAPPYRPSPWDSVPRRHYYVDRYQVQHFKPRGPRRWLQNPRNVVLVVLVGSGVVITVYFGNLETIPYTKRRHFVLLSRDMERRMGEAQFSQIKNSFKGKILPAIDPDSIRVRLISKDIIDALQRGLSREQVFPVGCRVL